MKSLNLTEEEKRVLKSMGWLEFVMQNPTSIKTRWILDSVSYSLQHEKYKEEYEQRKKDSARRETDERA